MQTRLDYYGGIGIGHATVLVLDGFLKKNRKNCAP